MTIFDILEIMIETLIPSALIGIMVYTWLIIMTNFRDEITEKHYGGWIYVWAESLGILLQIGFFCWIVLIILTVFDKIYNK